MFPRASATSVPRWLVATNVFLQPIGFSNNLRAGSASTRQRDIHVQANYTARFRASIAVISELTTSLFFEWTSRRESFNSPSSTSQSEIHPSLSFWTWRT
jgi:hypothetical protein